jgi:hypothetical protein
VINWQMMVDCGTIAASDLKKLFITDSVADCVMALADFAMAWADFVVALADFVVALADLVLVGLS